MKLLAPIVVLAIAIAVVVLVIVAASRLPVQRQLLADGSTLVLADVVFGATNAFPHGNQLENFLGKAIPSNGIAFSKFKLARPTPQIFSAPAGKTWLVAEFKLIGTNAQSNPLVSPASYRRERKDRRDTQRKTRGKPPPSNHRRQERFGGPEALWRSGKMQAEI